MREQLLCLLAMVMAQAARAEVPPQTTNYLGTINGNLPVAMALTTSSPRFEVTPRVEGSYLYLSRGSTIFLNTAGTSVAPPKADFFLREFGPHDNTTGTFELSIGKGGTIAGNWKSPDGRRNLPVALAPVAKTVTLISARTDQYDIQTGYLQLAATSPFAAAVNMQLQKTALESHNQELQSLAAEADRAPVDSAGLPWSIEERPSLLYASDTLISIRSLHYRDTGGAHGNSRESARNFAWVDGKLVSLTAATLLPEPNWPALRELCVRELKLQGASDAQDVKFDKTSPPVLNYTAQGLLVTFDPYAVGSFAEGEYVVALPYATVKPLIPAGSPLAALIPK